MTCYLCNRCANTSFMLEAYPASFHNLFSPCAPQALAAICEQLMVWWQSFDITPGGYFLAKICSYSALLSINISLQYLPSHNILCIPTTAIIFSFIWYCESMLPVVSHWVLRLTDQGWKRGSSSALFLQWLLSCPQLGWAMLSIAWCSPIQLAQICLKLQRSGLLLPEPQCFQVWPYFALQRKFISTLLVLLTSTYACRKSGMLPH